MGSILVFKGHTEHSLNGEIPQSLLLHNEAVLMSFSFKGKKVLLLQKKSIASCQQILLRELHQLLTQHMKNYDA